MDALGFVAKLFGSTARVGWSIFLAALALYLLRRGEIEPFTKIDSTVYVVVLLAGLFGAGVGVVDVIISVSEWMRSTVSKHLKNHKTKTISFKNLELLPPEYIELFVFLKAHNAQRFPAPANSTLLYYMRNAFLLEIDDPNYRYNARTTYYLVPDYIWSRIDSVVKDRPVPEEPPWIERTSWMAH